MSGRSCQSARRRSNRNDEATRSAREPRVPEEQLGGGAESPDLLADHVEREVVAELDAPHVLVKQRLQPLDERPSLLRVALARQLREEPVLLLQAPPARPVALKARREGGVGGESVA